MQTPGPSRVPPGASTVPYRCQIAADPPPLLSSLPGPTRVTLVVVVPLLFGAVCGFLVSETSAGWWIANAIAALGGVAGGYEHETARSGGIRGAIAGIAFGTGIVVADAVTAAPPVVDTPLMILFPLIAALGGLALGSVGGRLRAEHESRGLSPSNLPPDAGP